MVMFLSAIVNGLGVEWSLGEAVKFVVSRQFPAFIAAGIAQGTAVLVYRLTRQATDARRLGSYQLESLLGSGGMGEVWRARHRLLVRPAAIKLIRREALGKDDDARRAVLRRFEREAQATALLKSPHTVALYDFGVTDDGRFYYVMELLEGLDLKRLVERNGPVPQERALHILQQVCHSLADAHDAGLVHRDVKPANVFLGQRGADHDFVKVLDFGLVMHPRLDEAERTRPTGPGPVTGTPAFMAPELIQGRDVDARADLYGVGCVAYWLLTGALVFEGKSPREMMAKHIGEPPLPPSARSELPISSDVDTVILRCLAKQPQDRPPDARRLIHELAACAAASEPWTRERANAWWDTHRPALA
ncbi:MAG: serine/threonine protein kinase [Gemmatimonadetes bacterium]|nr:serine/threonine protein kinase [Gemmatimonadota bacterium]